MSNSLDPDQARQFVGPDLDLNCLQRFSADDLFCFVWFFTSLPTAMVMSGRSVHRTSFFLGKLD